MPHFERGQRQKIMCLSCHGNSKKNGNCNQSLSSISSSLFCWSRGLVCEWGINTEEQQADVCSISRCPNSAPLCCGGECLFTGRFLFLALAIVRNVNSDQKNEIVDQDGWTRMRISISLRAELLLFHIERRCLKHLFRMSPGLLLGRCFRHV